MKPNLFLKKLAGINDSPHKISSGAAIGVFFGVLPFAGLVVSVLVAAIFRVNKIGALIGCLLTNTWISLLCAIFAVNIGAEFFNIDSSEAVEVLSGLFKNFNIPQFLKVSSREFFLPFITGFFFVAFLFSVLAYFLTSLLIYLYKRFDKRASSKP